MAEKLGRLEFEGKVVDLNDYKEFLAPYLPKGKQQTVTFQMLNYQPYKALGIKTADAKSRGGMLSFGSGQRQLPGWDTVRFPVRNEKGHFVEKEGLLRYYETSTKQKTRDGAMIDNYSPNYLTFSIGVMTFSAKNLAKILYLLCHSENNRNALAVINGEEEGWSQKQPLFFMVLQSVKDKKLVGTISDKMKAFSLINELRDKNKKKLKQVYEASGYSDWDVYINIDGEGDYDHILAPLLNIADRSPNTILELCKDAALDLRALVTQALAQLFITYETGSFYWGPKAQGGKFIDKAPDEKRIVKLPVGKTNKDVARAWFVDWLSRNSEVLVDIKADIDTAVAEN